MARKAKFKEPPWKPFVSLGLPQKYLGTDLYKGARYLSNGTYHVLEIVNYARGITWLSIKRMDKQHIHDWRHLQRIKNAICGPEREGFVVYPAESRLNDTANHYHMWVLGEHMLIPVGYTERAVVDGDVPGNPFKSVGQRPLPEGTKVTEVSDLNQVELYDGDLTKLMRVRCRACWSVVPGPQAKDLVAHRAQALISQLSVEGDDLDAAPVWEAVQALQAVLDLLPGQTLEVG